MSKTQALNKLLIVMVLLMILLVTLQSHAQTQSLYQNLQVSLYPSLKMIKAEVRITFPKQSPTKLTFLIHRNLKVRAIGQGTQIKALRAPNSTENFAEYGLEFNNPENTVILQYSGVIYSPIKDNESDGLISPEGVSLFGTSYWYPVFPNSLYTFDVRIETPANWISLSQGQITGVQQDPDFRTTSYREIYPQQQIYLVAGPFFAFTKQVDGRTYQVLLRKNEAQLAQNYLDLVPGYIKSFSEKIAPYPYSGFAVVENFWETGYGMPSFTLLGPSVIRLPFILNTSLPHEVLHNWWGNSVYVDRDSGNWSEGLTTYMADYALQEESGRGRDYRLNALMAYKDYVSQYPSQEFALKDFRSRDSASSQAIGYGKSFFLFHMLKQQVGEDEFNKSIQDFYQNFQFKIASFTDIKNSFEKSTALSLSAFFSQWVNRTGAPRLILDRAHMFNGLDGSFTVNYRLKQEGGGGPYDLVIPITWTLENGAEFRQMARLSQSSSAFSFSSVVRPSHLSVDGNFDVFRQLYTEERPATLSSLLSSKRVHFFYDAKIPDQLKFAQAMGTKLASGAAVYSDISTDPPAQQEGDWIIIGDGPKIRDLISTELQGQSYSLKQDLLKLQGQEYKISQVSTVLVTRSKGPRQQNIAWIQWASDNNPIEWAQRLTHYGSFGILVFQGRPVVLKSTWPVLNSPLQKAF